LLRAKGVSDFVDAARRLKSRLPDVSFLLAGTSDVGSPEAIAAEEIENWRSDGLVHFLGQRDDMPELLAEVDLLVLPTYYGEGLPRILIEAAASGLALVATDVPGCREIVRHEENGLLVRTHDSGGIADAIERLMLDPIERHSMGQRSRAIACAEFSEEQVIRETLSVHSIAVRASSPSSEARCSRARTDEK
jgi:glycosyltransferase involved in cell wall biosynthesis